MTEPTADAHAAEVASEEVAPALLLMRLIEIERQLYILDSEGHDTTATATEWNKTLRAYEALEGDLDAPGGEKTP